MKKHVVILIFSITASLFSLTSCGNTTEAEERSSVATTSSTESVVYTPYPTPTPTLTPPPTVTPDPTASPTSDPSSSSGYVMSDELKQDLKTLGATDDEIAAIKSEKDMTDLVDKLITGGGTTGSSGSSSSSDTGFDDSIGDEVHDPSRVPQLGSGDTVQGSM